MNKLKKFRFLVKIFTNLDNKEHNLSLIAY